MKTNLIPTGIVSIILTLAAARGVAVGQEYYDSTGTPLGEPTDTYAPDSVVYEAPVVYNAPVIYETSVIYNAPVYYVNSAPEFAAPAPATVPTTPCNETSTVLVIGGGSGAYGYGHHGDSGQSVIRFGREGGWFGR